MSKSGVGFSDIDNRKSCDGHGHGGIVRLPGIGAVFGTHMDLFPDYTAGLYEKDGTAMVVSRGLGGSRKLPLRIGNRPEVVTVVLRTET